MPAPRRAGRGRETLHALPVQITPRRRPAAARPARHDRPAAARSQVHLVQVAAAPLHNLVAAVERCHLEVAGVVAAPYAAGIASLSADELDAGRAGARPRRRRHRASRASPTAACRTSTACRSAGATSPRTWRSACRPAGRRPSGSRPSTAACCRAPATPTSGSRCPGLGDPDGPAAADRVAGAADRDHAAAGRGDLPAGARPARGERAAAGRAPAGADRRRQHARGRGRAGRGDLRHAGAARPQRCRSTAGSRSPACRAARPRSGLLRWANQDDGGLTFWSPRPNRVISARLAKISQWLRENF